MANLSRIQESYLTSHKFQILQTLPVHTDSSKEWQKQNLKWDSSSWSSVLFFAYQDVGAVVASRSASAVSKMSFTNVRIVTPISEEASAKQITNKFLKTISTQYL